MKKTISASFRVFISLTLLLVLFRKIDFKGTLKVIAQLSPLYFISAIVIFLLIYVLLFYRWKMLLDARKAGVSSPRVFSSFSGGLFFNLFTPSTIGGDLSRSIDLGAHTKSYGVIAATVLLDRLSGFAGLVIVAAISLIFGYRMINDFSVYLTIFLFAVLLGGIFLVLFNEGIYIRLNRSVTKKRNLWENFRKLHSEIYFFRRHRAVLYANLGCSILIQAGASLFSYFILRSLNTRINILYPFVFNPVITVITAIPISIGGLGLRDASSIFFYAKAGVAKDVALAQSLLNFAVIVIFGLIAGIIYVSTLRYRRLQPHQADARSQ